MFKNHIVTASDEPVSVIICARNEAEELQKNLPSILNQDYNNYEVIVVNDCSTDDTGLILSKFKQEYDHLKVSTIQQDRKFFHGKQLAVTIGVKAARYEALLFTDPYCRASSNHWIKKMQRNIIPKVSFVLGYERYERKKGLFNRFIRFDRMFTALQYFSLALAGNPFKGFDKNICYRKSFFFKCKNFASRYQLTNDDSLLINDIATKQNTAIEFDSESHIISQANYTIREWFRKKLRNFQSATKYKAKTKFVLSTEIISRLFFYVSFIFMFFWGMQLFPYFLYVFLSREIIQLLVIKTTMNRLSEKKIFLLTPLFDIIIPFFYFVILLNKLLITDKSSWK